MAENNISQIRINGRLVGIADLDHAIAKAARLDSKDDIDIKKCLLNEISVNNYIPPSAQNAYADALLREFKIAHGLPVAEELFEGMNIEVVGMGCARCNQLENDVRDLLSEMNITAGLRHVTDFKEIARYNLLGSPALVINNKVVSVGDVPPKSKIRQWIIEAHQRTGKD